MGGRKESDSKIKVLPPYRMVLIKIRSSFVFFLDCITRRRWSARGRAITGEDSTFTDELVDDVVELESAELLATAEFAFEDIG